MALAVSGAEPPDFQALCWRSFRHSMATFFVEDMEPTFLAATVLRFTAIGEGSDRSAFTALMAARIWSRVTLLFPQSC